MMYLRNRLYTTVDVLSATAYVLKPSALISILLEFIVPFICFLIE